VAELVRHAWLLCKYLFDPTGLMKKYDESLAYCRQRKFFRFHLNRVRLVRLKYDAPSAVKVLFSELFNGVCVYPY
jgi:hypothetical protein